MATGKTVSVGGISISGGTDAANYTIDNTTATTTANITAKPITVVATGSNKIYDAGVADVVTLGSGQILTGDTVNFSAASATFGDKNVGNPTLIDTGAFANVLSLREGRQLGKVYSEDSFHVHGLNGEVNKVYSAKATLRFARLQQPSMDVVTFDLGRQSRRIGIEVSGFFGFAMLRMIDVKLDYRDGLVDFVYDPKRVSAFTR